MRRRLTTVEFIKRAIETHGDVYDYSLVEYIGAHRKVKIICLIHGIFEQVAGSHLTGCRCPVCFGTRRSTTEEFIKKSKVIYGNLHNYSLVEYKDNATKIKIICNEHGIFEKFPNNYLNGKGCPACIGKKKLNAEEFIKKSKIIHGNLYDYSLVEYKNNHTKVKIICKMHGVFEQKPNNHFNGQGCSKCAGLNTLDAIKKHIKLLSEIGVESRLNNNNLEVKCHNCKKWHIQTIANSWTRIQSAHGKKCGENNLYCSDECKNSCPVFNHKSNHIDPRSIIAVDKTEQELTRLCQNNILKQIQCDEKGYNYCEKCGDIIDVELHHTHEVSKYGVGSINSSGHILLCAGCHTELHSDCKN